MELLPQELRVQIPLLYSTQGEEDPMVWVKFFDPFSDWTWYVLEMQEDDDDVLFFGWVVCFEKEFGYFRLSELADLLTAEADRWHASVGVAADEHFEPQALSAVRDHR